MAGFFKVLATASYALLGVMLMLFATDGDPDKVAMCIFAYAFGIGAAALIYYLYEE